MRFFVLKFGFWFLKFIRQLSDRFEFCFLEFDNLYLTSNKIG